MVIAGVEQKAHYLVVDLPHSDAGFVQAFPAETTEAFCAGHNAAFDYFGGVPRRIVYDNTKLAVARISGTARASGRRSSASSSRTICSTLASAARARATTKARWKGWSGPPAATSSCRSPGAPVGTR